jgi:hypothetical protein
MKITQVATVYGLNGTERLVTQYVKTKYDIGNSTIDVTKRQYSIILYSANGKEDNYVNRGRVIDLQA